MTAIGLWIAIYFVCRMRIDPDYGWHVQSGAYILAHGVPVHDIFTYTAGDFRWINHEWLSDVIFRFITLTGGYTLLAAVMALVWVFALRLAAGDKLPWLVAAIGYMVLLPYLGVRPVAWTVLFLAMCVAALRQGESRWLWVLPVLFGLWANMHGGFVVGLGLLALAAIARRSGKLALVAALSVLASLLNPYGVDVYTEIFRTARDAQLGGMVTEWAPLSLSYGVLPYLLVAIVALVYVKYDLSIKLMSWVLLAMAVGANRQLPLLVILSIGIVSAGYLQWTAHLIWLRRPVVRVVTTGIAVLLVAGILLWPPSASSGQRIKRPAVALAALNAVPCRGAIFNAYSYGGAIIQTLPGTKVYIDGRMPSWSGREGRYLDRWARVMEGGDYSASEFKRYNVQCVLVKRSDARINTWLEGNGWQQDVTADAAILWRRD